MPIPSSPQDAETLQLQDFFKKNQEKSEFYRQQAVQADLVTPRRRCRLVSSDADNVLTPNELYQQLLRARDDIQVRDRALQRLKVQHTQLRARASTCLLHLRRFSHFM